ncbi:MAG: helix-turn-helix domain-containing protein [Anaerolinea sp.]|nr:helix-turn-helix domain-containing protein [Anaerolinea sp.]MCC6975841.1 helix-turn-helix domain-containing protein [Anaerolineae bacterium]
MIQPMIQETLGFTVRDVMRHALPLNTTVGAGSSALDNPVRWAVTVAGAIPYLEGGELALVISDGDDLAAQIEGLSAQGASAAAVTPPVPPTAIAAAEAHNLPLLVLPPNCRMREVERTIVGFILDRRASVERISAQIYQQMVQLASENAGLGRIIAELAKVINKGVVVQDKHLRILHECPSPELAKVWDSLYEPLKDRQRLPESLRDRHRLPRGAATDLVQPLGPCYRLVTPIFNQNMGRGHLSLIAAREDQFDEIDHLIITHAAVVCALEMSRAKVISEIEKKARGNFLTNLMTGTLSEPEAQAAIEQLGHDMNAPHIALVVRWYGQSTPSVRRLETLVNGYLGGAGLHALTQFYDNEVRIFLKSPETDPLQSARRIGAEIMETAQRENKQARVAVGIGSLAPKVWEWRTSYRAAANAADIARKLQAESPLYSGDIDIYTLLTRSEFRDDLRALRDKTIGSLLKYDEKQRADLLQTLEAFFECHGNHNQTAAMLSVHRNTLFYRMNRIQEITGLDLDQPDVRLAVHLSLKIHRLLNAES